MEVRTASQDVWEGADSGSGIWRVQDEATEVWAPSLREKKLQHLGSSRKMYNKKKRQPEISSVWITFQLDIKGPAVLHPNLISGLDGDLGLWGSQVREAPQGPSGSSWVKPPAKQDQQILDIKLEPEEKEERKAAFVSPFHPQPVNINMHNKTEVPLPNTPGCGESHTVRKGGWTGTQRGDGTEGRAEAAPRSCSPAAATEPEEPEPPAVAARWPGKSSLPASVVPRAPGNKAATEVGPGAPTHQPLRCPWLRPLHPQLTAAEKENLTTQDMAEMPAPSQPPPFTHSPYGSEDPRHKRRTYSPSLPGNDASGTSLNKEPKIWRHKKQWGATPLTGDWVRCRGGTCPVSGRKHEWVKAETCPLAPPPGRERKSLYSLIRGLGILQKFSSVLRIIMASQIRWWHQEPASGTAGDLQA